MHSSRLSAIGSSASSLEGDGDCQPAAKVTKYMDAEMNDANSESGSNSPKNKAKNVKLNHSSEQDKSEQPETIVNPEMRVLHSSTPEVPDPD